MSQLTARVPVGFRFHPTDEELVGYYLPKKVGALKIDLDLIRDLDLYKLEPWDLQELCKIQADSTEKQTDYYFFSRKDRKYPTGNRANRATAKGFWKATGRDKPIHTKLQTVIGMRKTLVFYEGRAPHGAKTDWIMHEFRLDDGPGRPAHEDGGWVVCRVFKKCKNLKTVKLLHHEERATVSYEDSQMGLLTDPIGSPDILSSGGRIMNFGSDCVVTVPVKREVINLDEYDRHGDHHLDAQNFGLSAPKGSVVVLPTSTSEQVRSCLTRSLSLKRPEDVNFYLNPYQDGVSSGQYISPQLTSNDETVSGSSLENVDWNSLLQEPASVAKGEFLAPAVMGGDRDMTILLQLKRQNSDLFSSLDLWN